MVPKERNHTERQDHHAHQGEERGARGECRAPQEPMLFGAERMKGLGVALINKRRQERHEPGNKGARCRAVAA